MKDIRKYIKPIAAFFLINFLSQIIYPNVALALTAGPTSPEFSSFEPVDTSDMVNLATGDFTYSLPLLEIPGPEGGYPINLAYHAGVKPDQESGWVGLGWSLNPGAINRYVNGYADDVFAPESNEVFWEGGETNAFTVGAGYMGLGGSITVANDTYKGIGVGFGAGKSFGVDNNIGVGFSAGVNPYGGFSAGVSAGPSYQIGETALAAGARMGVRFSSGNSGNSVSALTSGGVSVINENKGDIPNDNAAVLGVSLSSSNFKPSFTVAGLSVANSNNHVSKTTVKSSGFNMVVPIVATGAYFNFGWNRTRYYLHQTEFTKQYGSLHSSSAQNMDESSMDAVVFTDIDASAKEKKENHIYELNSGAYPAFDTYAVTGQGIGGTVSPYFTNFGRTFRQNIDRDEEEGEEEHDIFFQTASGQQNYSSKPSFRFSNDFSNALTWSGGIQDANSLNNFVSSPVAKVGEERASISNLRNSNASTLGYSVTDDKITTSSDIKWYTNEDIENGEKSLMLHSLDHNSGASLGGVFYDVSKQIRGFRVTAKNGMVYHYSLPAYSYNEVSYVESFDEKNKKSFSKTVKTHPYAYTWLLTGITGPDFIDRGGVEGAPNGIIDEGDYGYYVKFDYGRWTKEYKWRGPERGFEEDKINDSHAYHYGVKELYYLDAISTRSHTALFVKSMKTDGKSVESLEDGGFGVIKDEAYNVVDASVASLKLDKVLLFDNKSLIEALRDDDETVLSFKNLRGISNEYSHDINGRVIHEGQNIIDVHDLTKLPKNIEELSLRSIIMNQDYSLGRGVDNSFDLDYEGLKDYSGMGFSGKLSLNSISTQGLGAKQIMPPIHFDYYGKSESCNIKAKDNWGFYKSDFAEANQNPYYSHRYQSNASIGKINSWNLSGITSSLGAKIEIEYESDTYEGSGYSHYAGIPLNSVELISFDEDLVKINLLTDDFTLFESVVDIDVSYFARELNDHNCNGQLFEYVGNNSESKGEIVSLDPAGKSLVVKSSSLVRALLNEDCSKGYVEAGYVYPYRRDLQTYGGGLRVKKLSLVSDRRTTSTNYDYSEGKTSSVPMDKRAYYTENNLVGLNLDELKKGLKGAAKEFESNLLGTAEVFSAFLPSAGVVYGKVKVTNSVATNLPDGGILNKNIEGYVEYNYQAFEKGMFKVTSEQSDEVQNVFSDGGAIVNELKSSKTWKIRDYSSEIGALKAVNTYGLNNRLLYTTYTSYISDKMNERGYRSYVEDNYNSQGIFDQMYYESRRSEKKKTIIGNELITAIQRLVATKLEKLPSIPLGQTTIDHRKGVRSSTRTIGFDYYSGDATHTVTTDVVGNQIMSEVIPAYRLYPEMGSGNIGGPNMINQIAESSSWFVEPKNPDRQRKPDDFNKVGLLAANKTVWSDDVLVFNDNDEIQAPKSIWRAKETYVASNFSNRMHSMRDDVLSKPQVEERGDIERNYFWERVSYLDYVDLYSHPLQVSDVFGNSSVSLFAPENDYQIASFSMANIKEVAYCGGEFARQGETEGNVLLIGLPSERNPHTGKYAVRAKKEETAMEFSLNPELNKPYFASAWVYVSNDNGDLNNVKLVCRQKVSGEIISQSFRKENFRAGSYYLLQLEIPAQITNQELVVSCENNSSEGAAYFDDFRVHPIVSGVSSYVIDQSSGLLTHILNNDNLFSRFEYSPIGQLTETYTEVFDPIQREKIVAIQEYNYGEK